MGSESRRRRLRCPALATSSKLRARAVVVHGADYVHDKPVIQGRSNGCPALPMEQRTRVINLIKEGSLMYFARSQA